MLVNRDNNDGHVGFVSYDGKYPCLCTGTLVLEINGVNYSFGVEGQFPRFWLSGGTCKLSAFRDWKGKVTRGEWIIREDKIPKQLRQYASEIDEVFNNNVTHGCCGGCI